MFQLGALPKISFVGNKSLQELDLPSCGGEIQELAASLAQCIPEDAVVGLVFPTGPELVIAWLAILAAGRTPLILQYPNEKISKDYWKESIRNTLSRVSVGAVLCNPEMAAYGLGTLLPTFAYERDRASAGVAAAVNFPAAGRILQLSSGTTGFKKGIAFSFDALRRHAELYNQVLRLTAEDRIVSWLPLYHDMGFIACFVMPMLLGVPIVMIDPMVWVKQPQLLFEAIRQHNGSVCLMPNFGFEVMAKSGATEPFPTMRHWISCSEPTYPETLERFLQTTGAPSHTVSTCYGMAENVFAVTQSEGLRIVERDGRRHISCGTPIPGTEVKIVEGELFVRSPHSLQHYEEGGQIQAQDIRDEAGFYATGDTGFLHHGEVIVTGRKQDIANIGGRKYLLNDLDFTLAGLFPQSAGRIASLAVFDAASGTEKALFLIEADAFWKHNQSADHLQSVRDATGIEWLEVHFVPRQFITKTSSGKINRKQTLKDWTAVRDAASAAAPTRAGGDLAEELNRTFPGLSLEHTPEEQLDSLGQLMLRMFCEERGVTYLPDVPLASILKRQEARLQNPEPVAPAEIFSIVALIDGWRVGFGAPKPNFGEDFLNAISAEVGCPVHIEHLCVPAAPVLFSDLIFHDYFLPRNPDPAYDTVSSILRKIKNASLILIDDEDNFRIPEFCAYPVLNHRFTMHPDADLLGHRMQRYTQYHHLLPRDVVLGRDIVPESINPTLQSLESYLGIPLLRMAFHKQYSHYTADWEFRAFEEFRSDVDKIGSVDWVAPFQQVLLNFIRGKEGQWHKQPYANVGTQGDQLENRMLVLDTPHFCSFLLNRMAVDFVTRIYNSFCIVGIPSSLPYLQKRLDSLGKPYFFSRETTPSREDYECLILTGGTGNKIPDTDKPIFDFMHSRPEGDGGGRPHNVFPEIAHSCPPLVACDEAPFRILREKGIVTIGNYLLNHSAGKRQTTA